MYRAARAAKNLNHHNMTPGEQGACVGKHFTAILCLVWKSICCCTASPARVCLLCPCQGLCFWEHPSSQSSKQLYSPIFKILPPCLRMEQLFFLTLTALWFDLREDISDLQIYFLGLFHIRGMLLVQILIVQFTMQLHTNHHGCQAKDFLKCCSYSF